MCVLYIKAITLYYDYNKKQPSTIFIRQLNINFYVSISSNTVEQWWILNNDTNNLLNNE